MPALGSRSNDWVEAARVMAEKSIKLALGITYEEK
jgi:hypothetical protein